MSYLVDALRKAERERHLGRVPDLGELHEPGPEGRDRRLPPWVAPVVLALVLLNLGLLLAFWLLRDADPAPVVVQSPEPAAEASAPAPEPAPRVPESRPRETPAPAPAPAEPPARQEARQTPPSFDTYEATPEPADSIQALPADVRRRLPEIRVNGHLYSSIPGRSFLLVNGRRYREGERLREGPAVETIDEAGAVLNFHGERFRVEAPR